MNRHPTLVSRTGAAVPYSLIAESGLEADAISAVIVALERTLDSLGLTDRTDPITKVVALKLIELARQGERDPQRLADLTLQALQPSTRDTGKSTR
jgi:hypothetical protein